MISENFKPLAQNNVFIKSLVRKKFTDQLLSLETIIRSH